LVISITGWGLNALLVVLLVSDFPSITVNAAVSIGRVSLEAIANWSWSVTSVGESVGSSSILACLASVAVFPSSSDLVQELVVVTKVVVVVEAEVVIKVIRNTLRVTLISKLTSWAEFTLVGLLVNNLVATA
jgi:hypothetical protein